MACALLLSGTMIELLAVCDRCRTSKEDRTYHSVKLDDPSFTAPIYANLFEGENGEYALIWSR